MFRSFPIRLFGYYYKIILRYNAMFSVLSFLFTGLNYHTFLYSFLTMGFAVALLFFYLWREPEYYFYYNRGLSKLKLMSMAYALNLIMAITLWIFFKKVGLW